MPYKLFNYPYVYIEMTSEMGETEPSFKSSRHIFHASSSVSLRSEFALPIKKPVWPDIWHSGSLVYHIKHESKCLGPATSPKDTVLRFNSRFESGNLLMAYRLCGDSYHLILEYDKNASGSCQWFYFQVMNVQRGVRYTFYISGFHKNNGVFASGSKVFMYSEQLARRQNTGWIRAGTRYGYGVTLKSHGEKRSTLQFQIEFPYDSDTVYLAYAIPYTYTDLIANITKWKRATGVSFTSSTLCRTLGGRDCPLLTITAPDSIIPYNEKSCIFLTGRVHPGESNGSIMLHGLIDFLLSHHQAAKYLLDRCVVFIVPMINIDGVIEGYYRSGLSGDDLNRVWTNPDRIQHPVVYHTKQLLESIAEQRRIAAYIDFHGHSRLHGTFAYGCPNDNNPLLADTEKRLPKIISVLSDGFSWKRCVFSYPNKRKDASRIVLRKELDIVHSFTIESSFGGIVTGPRTGVLYDEKMWKEMGARIGESLYYLISGTFPTSYALLTKEKVKDVKTSVNRKPSTDVRCRASARNLSVRVSTSRVAKGKVPKVRRLCARL